MSNSNHLVVLAHGMMGSSVDLGYLSQKLEEKGCIVLNSSANQLLKSLDGIATCGDRLADEIKEFQLANLNLQYISFVGHSLGGLILRYAIKILYNEESKLISNLQPKYFMTTATPHIGLRHQFSDFFEIIASSLFSLTGN